jgi:hypothetical protein
MRSACAPGNRGGAGVSSNDTKGIAMKLPITYVLMAGALALAAATPAAFAATGDDTSADYKAALEKCKVVPDSDKARCRDAAVRAPTPDEKTGGSLEGMSPQAQQKCARLSGDAQRDCLINDKGG